MGDEIPEGEPPAVVEEEEKVAEGEQQPQPVGENEAGANDNVEVVVVPTEEVEEVVEQENVVTNLGEGILNEMDMANEFDNLLPVLDDPLDIFTDFSPLLPNLQDIVDEDEEELNQKKALAFPETDNEVKTEGAGEKGGPVVISITKPDKQKQKQDSDHDLADSDSAADIGSLAIEDFEEVEADEMEIFSDTKVTKKKSQKKKKTSWMPFIPLKKQSIIRLVKDDEDYAGPAERSGADNIIENLITTTLEICEYEDPDEKLRARLDRDKVLALYIEKYNELQYQTRRRTLLSRKLTDYYRRKKVTKVFYEDNQDTFLEKARTLRQTINELDKLKGREEKTRQETKEKIESLTITKADLIEQCTEQAEKLALLLKEIGLSTQSLKTGQFLSEKAVDSLIRKMTYMRKQVAEVRYNVIQSQHRLAVLTEQAKKLEDLGNGLQMLDFEQLQADTTGLGEKIEERSVELSKLRVRCNQDTNILAHTREKLQIDENKIYLAKNDLIYYRSEQNYARNVLHGLKLDRDKIRKKINQMSFECGLLDKPTLLIDYDETQVLLHVNRNRIAALKKKKYLESDKLNRLELKLSKFQKRN